MNKESDTKNRPAVLMTDQKSPGASDQLEAVFRASPDLLLLFDAEAKILDYKAGNPSALFLPPAEFLGKRLLDVLPDEIGEKFTQAVRQTILTGKGALINYELNAPDGEHWFEARTVSLPGNLAIAVIRDISERVQSSERIQRQSRQLSAIQSIDAAITASFDLNVTLSVILRQVINQLGVDAADVLLLNQNTHMLEFAAGQGFRTANLAHTSLMIGQGYAGQAALKRHTVSVPDIGGLQPESTRLPSFLQEGFNAYHAVPLIAKGQVTGVLEVYRRAAMRPTEEWLEFLTTLAGQAAIAIDSASLFRDLQRANAELTLAYDAAIEGWAQALELSGRENADHVQRVVKMTTELAHSMGVSENELVHVRRGALLHDIGKMGIPESILNKVEPLTDQEWAVIRKHPQFSVQLLSTLIYQAATLDIPRHHHEKWDGSGYPEGIKEEQIPLAARIFAVVDVYDALTTPRPYRPAYSHEEALAYIREQTGRHFDPAVVAAFLRKIGKS